MGVGSNRQDLRRWRSDSAPTALDSAALVLLAARHYVYYWFPTELQGEVFALFGAAAIVGAVVLLRIWAPIAIWIIAEEVQVAGCALWWIASPLQWADEQCSARIDFKLGSIGIAWLALVCVRYVMSYRCSNAAETRK